MALPLARVTIQREKEKELRKALWDMRDAIDRYKDAADRQHVPDQSRQRGYPPTSRLWSKELKRKVARRSVSCVLSPWTP